MFLLKERITYTTFLTTFIQQYTLAVAVTYFLFCDLSLFLFILFLSILQCYFFLLEHEGRDDYKGVIPCRAVKVRGGEVGPGASVGFPCKLWSYPCGNFSDTSSLKTPKD